MENGIYPDLSHSDYHAMTDRVSNSYLSRLAVCPGAAKVPQEETPAMTFGRAFHCFVLDGLDAFSREVAVEPEVNRRTNDGKLVLAAFQEANKGKAIIATDDVVLITEMDKAIKAHPMAKRLIGTGTNEVSVLWTDPFSGLPCKARPDTISDEIQHTLIDLKTVKSADVHNFTSSVVTYGYAVSKDQYDLFVFIAVEKTEPFKVAVFTLSPTFIEWGRSSYQYLINIENKCRQTGEWPNYTEAGVTELEMPKWLALKQEG
jgi:hypothetical protein